jgi:hypothetical protein
LKTIIKMPINSTEIRTWNNHSNYKRNSAKPRTCNDDPITREIQQNQGLKMIVQISKVKEFKQEQETIIQMPKEIQQK